MLFNLLKGGDGCISGGLFGISLSYGWNVTKNWKL